MRGSHLKKGLHDKSLSKTPKFDFVMHEGHAGRLHSGKGGPIVRDPKQMIAIAFSEAKRHHGRL